MSETLQPAADRPAFPTDYGVATSVDGLLRWSHVEERLRTARHYWIITATTSGQPHAIPIWGAWADGAIFFDGSPQTRWARNLAANPQIVVHLESGDDVVIVHGTARFTHPAPEVAQQLAAGYAAKYSAYQPTPDDLMRNGMYRVTPRKVLAWTDFAKDATRWRLKEDA
jgi:nitroimidazol reductase NimA-like FMN-containing flavoprotein (pyridoxamine 5'-phosphate oxidase superfamily)